MSKENITLQLAKSFCRNHPDKISISKLQRYLKIGFMKAADTMDIMEEQGFVSYVDLEGKRKLLK